MNALFHYRLGRSLWIDMFLIVSVISIIVSLPIIALVSVVEAGIPRVSDALVSNEPRIGYVELHNADGVVTKNCQPRRFGRQRAKSPRSLVSLTRHTKPIIPA